jgi:hypothetical protein
VGGWGGFVAFLAAGRNAERTAKALVVGGTVAALAIGVQGLLVP